MTSATAPLPTNKPRRVRRKKMNSLENVELMPLDEYDRNHLRAMMSKQGDLPHYLGVRVVKSITQYRQGDVMICHVTHEDGSERRFGCRYPTR